MKCKTRSQTSQAEAELRSVSGFLQLLAAGLFICVEMSATRPTRFPRLKKTLPRLKKRPRLEMFSVRTCMSLQRPYQSRVDSKFSRKPSQKAAYMADTPIRKRKDHVAQTSWACFFILFYFLFGCQPCIAHLFHCTNVPQCRQEP